MSAHSTVHVLYVDDDSDTRLTFRWIFEQAGFGFEEAGTGREALQLAANQPDVVILDVNLPDMTGFEVCHRLKANPATLSIPVLHLSAVYVSPSDRTQGLEGGADAYLTKPVEPGELLAHIHVLLRVRQAEEKARAEARHWQATFDAISDGVCLLDREGRIVRGNEALPRIVGQPVGQLLGSSYADLIPARPGPPQILPFAAMLASRRREVSELVLGDRWLRASADPLFEADNSIGGAVFILSDITERRRLEEQLLQAQKMEAIGQLAGGIAHDFNNLLTAITGNVSLALSNLTAQDASYELLLTTEKAAWRAAELVRQLLGFSRRAMLWLRPTNLNTCAAEVVEILRRAMDPCIRLEMHTVPDPWPVQADGSQINQILLNLCLNARDAMPSGGSLVLETENVVVDEEYARQRLDARPGRFVRLRVSDTGEGIAPEVLPFIFDPFFTTKPVGKGSGLGLAMVFGIVKQHQGWIECVSTPGHGTRFDLYLPCTPPGPVQPAVMHLRPHGDKETVLLVDDEESVRNWGRMVLQRYGYQVLLAEDGAQAVDIYRQEKARIKLVLLDLTMPRMSGQETLEKLLQIHPNAPVLLASGYSAEHVNPDMQKRTLGFIGKPYRPDYLAQEVRRALDKAKDRN